MFYPTQHQLSKALRCPGGLRAARALEVGCAPAVRPACVPELLGVRPSHLGPERQTLPVTARHWDGALEYDMHNLYGHSMALATHSVMQAVTGRRPFILTRRAARALVQSPRRAWPYILRV